MEKSKCHTVLENGIQVIYVHTPTVTSGVALYIGEGWHADSKDTWGETHLLEHLFFAGNTPGKEEELINETFESLGALFNASVRREYSSYVFEVPSKKVKELFTLICDLISKPHITEKEIHAERLVMEEEHRLYLSDPAYRITDLYETIMYPHPYDHGMFSSPIHVAHVDEKRYQELHHRHFFQAPFTILITGNHEWEDLKEMVEQVFGALVRSPENEKNSVALSPKSEAPQDITFSMPSETVHVGWGITLPPLSVDNSLILREMALKAFGGADGSRLRKYLRNEGIGYNVGSSFIQYRPFGYLWVGAEISKEQTAALEAGVEKVFKDLLVQPFTKNELERIFAVSESEILREMQSPFEYVDDLAFEFHVEGSVLTPQEKIELMKDALKKINDFWKSALTIPRVHVKIEQKSGE